MWRARIRGWHVRYLKNPTGIFEVLSPSTGAYDRGEKFWRYRALPSLREYLFVSQDRPLVEQYTRQTRQNWLLSDAFGLNAEIEMAALGLRLALRDLYDRIAFEPAPAAQEQS